MISLNRLNNLIDEDLLEKDQLREFVPYLSHYLQPRYDYEGDESKYFYVLDSCYCLCRQVKEFYIEKFPFRDGAREKSRSDIRKILVGAIIYKEGYFGKYLGYNLLGILREFYQVYRIDPNNDHLVHLFVKVEDGGKVRYEKQSREKLSKQDQVIYDRTVQLYACSVHTLYKKYKDLYEG